MRSLENLFQDRTHYEFSDKKIKSEDLVKIYELMKLGPTSANSCPLRIFFASSAESKEKLLSVADNGNKASIKSAPITALFAYDIEFYKKMDKLFPHNSQIKKIFSENQNLAEETAFRNSTLQAAYFLILARGLDIACGPMSGFATDKLNNLFFANSSYKINFICNLGYTNNKDLKHPKLPRLPYKEVMNFL